MKNPQSTSGGLTDQLKALLLGGALTVAATQSASAAGVPAAESKEALDARIQSVREKLKEEGGTQANILKGTGSPSEGSDLMWWRNIWGNGGWHNWHNGWHNWGNHWGNWHNI